MATEVLAPEQERRRDRGIDHKLQRVRGEAAFSTLPRRELRRGTGLDRRTTQWIGLGV